MSRSARIVAIAIDTAERRVRAVVADTRGFTDQGLTVPDDQRGLHRALEQVRRRYALADRFILYVGTIEPRKNLPKLIDAFAERRKSGDLCHQLVCASRGRR